MLNLQNTSNETISPELIDGGFENEIIAEVLEELSDEEKDQILLDLFENN